MHISDAVQGITAVNTVQGLIEAGILGLKGAEKGLIKEKFVREQLQRFVTLCSVAIKVLANDTTEMTASSSLFRLAFSKLLPPDRDLIKTTLERACGQAETLLADKSASEIDRSTQELRQVDRILRSSMPNAAAYSQVLLGHAH